MDDGLAADIPPHVSLERLSTYTLVWNGTGSRRFPIPYALRGATSLILTERIQRGHRSVFDPLSLF